MASLFHHTVGDLVSALAPPTDEPFPLEAAPAVSAFVLAQHARMPGYFRLPIRILTLMFEFSPILSGYGRRFHGLAMPSRRRFIAVWRQSRFGHRRALIKFFESLAVFGWVSECPQVYEHAA